MKYAAALIGGLSIFGLAHAGLGWLSEWWCKADPIDDETETPMDDGGM